MLKELIIVSLSLIIVTCVLSANVVQKEQSVVFSNTLPKLKLEYGTAILKGQIKGNLHDDDLPIIVVTSPGKSATSYEITLNKDGAFELAIPVLAISNIVISSKALKATAFLLPNKETKIDICLQYPLKPVINIESPISSLTLNDYLNLGKVSRDIVFQMPDVNIGANADISPEKYLEVYLDRINKTDLAIMQIDSLSDNAKYMLHKLFWSIGYDMDLSKYRQCITNSKTKYIQKHQNLIGFKEYNIDRSYYRILKYCDFNDTNSLYSFYNSEVMKNILSDSLLHVPAIDSIPLKKWLTETTEIFNDLIGFEKRFFIDLLLLNTYSKQIEDSKPLLPQQIHDIENYFTSGNLANFLLDENRDLLKTLSNNVNHHPLVVNKIPKSTKGLLLRNIVNKYKGRVVFVDFWATWCGPCLKGIQLSKTVKSGYEGTDVVFVYITNVSSQKDLWEKKILQIGGEHYYLNEKEWGEVLDQYDFSEIPCYMVFDRKGVLLHQKTGVLSPSKMKEWIDHVF